MACHRVPIADRDDGSSASGICKAIAYSAILQGYRL
jgi:hypothetical protein